VAVTSFSLLCASLLLTAYSAKNPSVGRAGGVVIGELVSPINALVQLVHETFRSSWDRYVYLLGVEEENEHLRGRLQQLEGDLALLNEFRGENERLRKLLNFTEDSELKGVAGTVIGSDPTGWVRGIVIDKGTADGISVGMAVVHTRGVVGQVISTGPTSSRILLISDHSSGVDAIVQGSRVRGVVEGSGAQLCELRYVTREYPVKQGEVILTSGMDGIFPKGLIIGTVSAVEQSGGAIFQTVELKPAVDFTRLEEVLVVTSTPARDAPDSNPVLWRLKAEEE
jgi:rod shape-determining protein MreC